MYALPLHSFCHSSSRIHLLMYMCTYLIADGHLQVSEWQIKISICGVAQRTVAVYRDRLYCCNVRHGCAVRGYCYIWCTCAPTQQKMR